MGNGWIAERLRMGHHGAVSQLVVAASQDEKHERELRKLIQMWSCVIWDPIDACCYYFSRLFKSRNGKSPSAMRKPGENDKD